MELDKLDFIKEETAQKIERIEKNTETGWFYFIKSKMKMSFFKSFFKNINVLLITHLFRLQYNPYIFIPLIEHQVS